jgi:group I intron endonuclease
MPTWTIYCHIHTESGRRYVGLTKKTMLQRWNQHIANSKSKRGKGCLHLWNAIRKYGPAAFSHEILETCNSVEAANLAEQKWVEKLDSRNPEKGFNLVRGGSHTPHPIANPWDRPEYRARLTPERRAFLSKLRKGKPLSRETRNKISISLKKNVEHIAKLKEMNRSRNHEYYSNMAKSMSPEVRAKINAMNTGRIVSTETRAKLSASYKTPVFSPEGKARMSCSFKGKTHTPEVRIIIAKAACKQKRGPHGNYIK